MVKDNIMLLVGLGLLVQIYTIFLNKYPQYNIINLDKLTYAGNLEIYAE